MPTERELGNQFFRSMRIPQPARETPPAQNGMHKTAEDEESRQHESENNPQDGHRPSRSLGSYSLSATRFSLPQHRSINRRDRSSARQRHGSLEFRAEDVDNVPNSIRAGHAQPIEIGPADQHRRGPVRHRFQDIAAAPDP